MKRIIMLVLLTGFLTGCMTSFGETEYLNNRFSANDAEKEQAKVTVVRSGQYNGSACNIRLFINEMDAALIPSNKYAIFYLERGAYKFKARNECDIFGIRKTWDVLIISDEEQEYFVEHGFWGQLRATQIK